MKQDRLSQMISLEDAHSHAQRRVIKYKTLTHVNTKEFYYGYRFKALP